MPIMDTKIRKNFLLLYPSNDFSKRMYEYIQGKLAELAPAYRAMSIKPIEAIRDE